MRLTFLTPRIDLLSSDGSVATLYPGSVLGRFRKPVVLLARDLTSFSHFETGGLPRGRRRQAARLQTRLASPYLVSGAVLVPTGSDYGIWWWDLERVAHLLGDRYGPALPKLRPETMAQPPGEGWRIARLASGFEGQFWRKGGLVSSAWRKDGFVGTAWVAFASLQRDEVAPSAPPVPTDLPLALDSIAFSLARAEVTREQALAGVAGGFAVIATLTAAFLLGQGLALDADATKLQRATAEMRLASNDAGSTQNVSGERQRLAAFQRLEQRTNPITAAGAAIGILALHDLSPRALAVDDGELSVTVPYEAVEKAGILIADFEQSGYFYDVRPRTEASSQSFIIEAKVREATPPLLSGA